MEMLPGLELLWSQAGRAGNVHLEKGRIQGELRVPKGAPGELERDWGQGLEGQEPGNGFKMPEGSDGWDPGKEFLAGKVGRPWNRISRAAVAAPGSLAVSKARLDIGAGSSLAQWEVSLRGTAGTSWKGGPQSWQMGDFVSWESDL